MIGSVCLLLVFCAPQQLSSQQQQPVPPRSGLPQADEPGPSIPPQIQKDMEKKANEQRQAELKRDAERLLKLSTELKEYVDKSNQNTKMDTVHYMETLPDLSWKALSWN